MNTIVRRNVKFPFSKEQAKTAFVSLHTSRERRDIKKLKNIMLSEKEVHVFNYSIPAMEKAISGKSETLPAINSVDDLDNWLHS